MIMVRRSSCRSTRSATSGSMPGSFRAATTSWRAASRAMVCTAMASSRPRFRFSASAFVPQAPVQQLRVQPGHLLLHQRHLLRRQLLHQLVVLERGHGRLPARGWPARRAASRSSEPSSEAFRTRISHGSVSPGSTSVASSTAQAITSSSSRAGNGVPSARVSGRPAPAPVWPGRACRTRSGSAPPWPTWAAARPSACGRTAGHHGQPAEAHSENEHADHRRGSHHAEDRGAFLVDDLPDLQPHQPEGQAR